MRDSQMGLRILIVNILLATPRLRTYAVIALITQDVATLAGVLRGPGKKAASSRS